MTHLNLVVVNLVPEPVSVGRVGDDVTAGEVRHHEALPRQRDVDGRGQPHGGVQRAEEVAEGRVHQDRTVYGETKL